MGLKEERSIICFMPGGLRGGLSGKESPVNAGDMGLIPKVGKIP